MLARHLPQSRCCGQSQTGPWYPLLRFLVLVAAAREAIVGFVALQPFVSSSAMVSTAKSVASCLWMVDSDTMARTTKIVFWGAVNEELGMRIGDNV